MTDRLRLSLRSGFPDGLRGCLAAVQLVHGRGYVSGENQWHDLHGFVYGPQQRLFFLNGGFGEYVVGHCLRCARVSDAKPQAHKAPFIAELLNDPELRRKMRAANSSSDLYESLIDSSVSTVVIDLKVADGS